MQQRKILVYEHQNEVFINTLLAQSKHVGYYLNTHKQTNT